VRERLAERDDDTGDLTWSMRSTLAVLLMETSIGRNSEEIR
jgi:hypothetical protein